MTEFRSGFASFVGRPNAGKSTLTNALVGDKIAITSSRPQTTRHAIRGLVHRPDAQLIVVDTPGVHRPRTLLGERLNNLVRSTWAEVDTIGMCFPADQQIGPGDKYLINEMAAFKKDLAAIVEDVMETIVPEVVKREETKSEQKRADKTMEDARSHLRGFARTIPMFLMAYGDRDTRLANFDDYTPDDVFEEITGITEAEFRVLRDGQEITEDDGTVTTIPGLFDESVFDQALQEFQDKKEALADYFDDELTEDIFAYIPRQLSLIHI